MFGGASSGLLGGLGSMSHGAERNGRWMVDGGEKSRKRQRVVVPLALRNANVGLATVYLQASHVMWPNQHFTRDTRLLAR